MVSWGNVQWLLLRTPMHFTKLSLKSVFLPIYTRFRKKLRVPSTQNPHRAIWNFKIHKFLMENVI